MHPIVSQLLQRTRGLLALGLLFGVGFGNVTRLNAATTSTAFGTVDMNSRIYVFNNTWGSASAGSGWSESVTTNSSNSWRTDFNWPAGSNANGVKAYPAAILGWHYGWHFASGTGLPVQLSAGQSVSTTYNYTASFGSGGTADVSYDCWLHTQSNPGSSTTPSDEIMIWVNRTGGAGPIGGVIATVSIDGSTWDLHQGNIGWEVWSFVRQSNSGSGTINIKDFTDYLRNSQGLSSSKYLSSVEFGTEVFHGTGNLNVSNYTCVVGAAGGGGGGGSGPVANGTYSLQNRATGKMLDNLGSTADGANVAQWADGSSNNQRWTVTFSGGFYTLTCVTGGKRLDSINHTANGSTVAQWSASASANQQWTVTATSGGYYRLVDRANGKCLDTGAQTTDGAVMQFWPVATTPNQEWRFVAP